MAELKSELVAVTGLLPDVLRICGQYAAPCEFKCTMPFEVDFVSAQQRFNIHTRELEWIACVFFRGQGRHGITSFSWCSLSFVEHELATDVEQVRSAAEQHSDSALLRSCLAQLAQHRRELWGAVQPLLEMYVWQLVSKGYLEYRSVALF